LWDKYAEEYDESLATLNTAKFGQHKGAFRTAEHRNQAELFGMASAELHNLNKAIEEGDLAAVLAAAGPVIAGMVAGGRIGRIGTNFSVVERKLQHIFDKHAKDFGFTGNWSKESAASFRSALANHLEKNPDVVSVPGRYRGIKATHHVDTKTGVNVVTDEKDNVVTGYKLSGSQLHDVLANGWLW